MNTELQVLQNNEKETISSLDLVKQINVFRKEEGNRSELRHDTLREIIKNEFSEEILSQEILEKSISSNGGRPLKIYILSLDQAKQILMRESKFVRKAMIKYINQLENKVKELEYELSKRDNLIGKIVTSENQQKRIEYFEIFYNEYVKPNEQKAIFYDKVADNKKYIDFKTVAKLLEDLGFGRNLLLALLRDKKILMRDNQPYQIYVDNGYLKTKEIYIDKSNKIAFQPLISQKGLDWLIKKLIEWNYLNKKQVENINTQKLF